MENLLLAYLILFPIKSVDDDSRIFLLCKICKGIGSIGHNRTHYPKLKGPSTY